MSFSIIDPDPATLVGLVDIGRAFREARRRRGLSQDALARLSGVSQSSISRLERGRAPYAPVHRLASLARALSADITLRVGGDRRGLGQ